MTLRVTIISLKPFTLPTSFYFYLTFALIKKVARLVGPPTPPAPQDRQTGRQARGPFLTCLLPPILPSGFLLWFLVPGYHPGHSLRIQPGRASLPASSLACWQWLGTGHSMPAWNAGMHSRIPDSLASLLRLASSLPTYFFFLLRAD